MFKCYKLEGNEPMNQLIKSDFNSGCKEWKHTQIVYLSFTFTTISTLDQLVGCFITLLRRPKRPAYLT